MGVIPSLEGVNGCQQVVHTAGYHAGEEDADQNSEHTDQQCDIAQVGLETQQDFCLFAVVFIDVNGADYRAAIGHWHGGLTAERIVLKRRVKHVLSLQRLNQFLEQGIFPLLFGFLRVVEDFGVGVRHHNPGQTAVSHQRHDLLNAVLPQIF